MAEEEGRYIYGIIANGEGRRFGPLGIGGRGEEVYTICYRDISAVVSSYPVTKPAVNRENLIAHQRVMEEVMEEYPILPVRFGTIAEAKKRKGDILQTHEERIKRQVLESRYKEFKDLLEEMSDKKEFGVKGLWVSMEAIFTEIVKENQQIALLNKQVICQPPTKTQAQRMKLGEMVMKALEQKKAAEEEKILRVLRRLAVDSRQNKNYGDKMFMNWAFLVQNEREGEFDNAVGELSERCNGRVQLKYVGPVPPCNFVEIAVTWED